MRAVWLGLILWHLMAWPSSAADAVFPLRPAPGARYLGDQRGRPFLITGDTAWSMIADLKLNEAERYLDIRKSQGFNAVIISLIEHAFARNAPANFYGDLPFADAAFEKPNDAYFARAEAFVEAAARRNMLVLLAPAYLGAGGGPHGWYLQMSQAGPAKLKEYGRYVGRRFAKYPNVIWLQGGDYDPADLSLVTALAEGIAEGAPGALQTVHANRDTVTDIFWQGAGWLAIDTVYTYDDVAASTLARYRAGPQRPFVLIEGRYEGEHGVGESEARLIAYGALLSGAGGQFFGNNPVWHFSAEGLYAAGQTWQEALQSPGARSMTALARFFGGLRWWDLMPDQGELLKAANMADSQVFAALDKQGKFAVIYAADARRLVVDTGRLSGIETTLRWYDPSNGTFLDEVVRLAGGGVHDILVPQRLNHAGFNDWVGLLSRDH